MKMITRIVLSSLVLAAACAAPKQITQPRVPGTVVDGKVFTTAYQQTAAEYKALCYQAFNFATLRVDQAVPTHTGKPLAIITDIDETVLDNSPYAAKRGLEGMDYEAATWAEWTAKGAAEPVPGATNFLKYAAGKGITIFYLSNRAEAERTGTLANLQKVGFPNADNEHLVLRKTTSSKEEPRQDVLKNYDVLLLMGDNLTDFSALFEKNAFDVRTANVDKSMAEFGNRFIVLPNPVYGDWESVLYNYNFKLSPAQKDSAVKSRVTGY